MIVYISIGNSDDKLPQWRWKLYVECVQDLIYNSPLRIHGEWFSLSPAAYQNACWCVEGPIDDLEPLRAPLTRTREEFGQDSIAWAEAPNTEFI